MAGQLNEVRNRIKSTQSTQQLTKAMKMVSAAKLRRAQDAITQMRPYTRKLQEMLGNILSSLEGDMNLALAETRPVNNVLLIVITSDRGLCGGYNANLVKLARTTITEKYPKQKVTIWNIGKKGYESLSKAGFTTNANFKDIFLNLNFENVQLAAQAAMDAFSNKEFDAIEIIYSEFKMPLHKCLRQNHFYLFQKLLKKKIRRKLILFSNLKKKCWLLN